MHNIAILDLTVMDLNSALYLSMKVKEAPYFEAITVAIQFLNDYNYKFSIASARAGLLSVIFKVRGHDLNFTYRSNLSLRNEKCFPNPMII